MKIIFSPSKEMNFKNNNFVPFENKFTFSKESKKIYEILIQLSKEEISKKFKIKDNKLDDFIKNLYEFDRLEEKATITAYSGIAFRQLLLNEYTYDDFKFIEEYVYVLSAFYGYSRGMDLIRSHRLDFGIKIFDEMSLYKYWEKYVNSIFKDDEIVFNLASEEYSKLLDRKKIKMIDFEFFENNNFQKISTNSKKARGEMLNLIIVNKILYMEEIKNLKMREYMFSTEYSTDTKLVFIKNK